MRISETLTSFRMWISSWFPSGSRDSLLDVLDSVKWFADKAMPIVEAIDLELKPAIRTSHDPLVLTIEQFVQRHSDASSEEAIRLSSRIQRLPTADMLVHVALFLLSKSSPSNTAISILRLAIELAYNVYKGVRSETKVS